MWLWHAKEHISFDEGYRVAPFSKLNSNQDFGDLASHLAHSAADEVVRYRKLFRTVHDVCRYYSSRRAEGLWPTFNAAVGSALDGNPDHAKRLFGEIMQSSSDGQDWVAMAQSEARRLCAIAGDRDRFRKVMAETILRTRRLQKLPAIHCVDFDS
jgi:hypothetical protein